MTRHALVDASSEAHGFVAVTVGGQAFGVPVLQVQDVIKGGVINATPMAPPEVAGLLNLRGRIVTAIDMRVRLGLAPREPGEGFLCVIVELASDLYALMVDDVGEVQWLDAEHYEATPPTASKAWRELTEGLYRREGELMLVLSIEASLKLL